MVSLETVMVRTTSEVLRQSLDSIVDSKCSGSVVVFTRASYESV
jgi:hypothetical protein